MTQISTDLTPEQQEQFFVYSITENIDRARFWCYREYNAQTQYRMELDAIENMIKGAPPIPQEELDAAGLSYMINKNFGDARTHIRSVEYTFWSLWNEVKNVVDFSFEESLPKPVAGQPGYDYTKFQQIAADEFSKILKAYSAFATKMNVADSHLARFGVSLLFCEDDHDFLIEVVHPRNIILPRSTRNFTSEWYIMGVITDYSPQKLWEIVNNPDTAKSLGWNIDALRELLLRTQTVWNPGEAVAGAAWDMFYSNVTNNAQGIDAYYKSSFQLIKVFAKNKDGKIETVILDKGRRTVDFLYKHETRFKSFEEFCFLLTFQPGIDYYYDNIGVGQDIYENADVINQIDCRVLDQVHRSSTLFLTTPSAGPNQESGGMDITFGAMNDLHGGKLEQSNIYSAISPTIAGAQYFRNNLYNSSIFGGWEPNTPDAAQKSSGELALRAQKEARVYKNYIAHHYDELDNFFRFLFKRFLTTSSGLPGYRFKKYFLSSLERHEVPTEFFDMEKEKGLYGLPVGLDVTASRILGSGSQAGDMLLIEREIGLAGFLGQQGRKNLGKQAFAMMGGYEHLSELFPPEDEPNVQNNDDSIAELENNSLRLGFEVTFGINQDHVRHATRHMVIGTDLQKEIESGSLDPAKYKQPPDKEPVLIAYEVLTLWAPHVVKHLLEADKNPYDRAEVKQLKIVWGSLVNFGRKMQAAAQSIMERQQNQKQTLSDKQQEIQSDNALKTQEQQLKHGREMIKIGDKRVEMAGKQRIELLYSQTKARGEADAEMVKAIAEARKILLQNDSKDEKSGANSSKE